MFDIAADLLKVNYMPNIYNSPLQLDFEYNKEIINQYKCGVYVDPMDSDAIAEKIKYLLENKQIAKEMGENGRKAAETCFSWNNDESRLIALYKRLYQEKNSKKS